MADELSFVEPPSLRMKGLDTRRTGVLASRAMPYIERIHIAQSRNVRDLDIELLERGGEGAVSNGPPFRHLILTGPNGSGKSGVLETIAEEIRQAIASDRQLSLPHIDLLQNAFRWTVDDRRLPELFARGEFITVLLPARRNIRAGEVRGPMRAKRRKPEELMPATNTAGWLHQSMVNKHVGMTYALASGDRQKAQRIQEWFDAFEQHMRRITEDENLSMLYEPHSFEFKFRRSDGYVFDLRSLADGYAAILALLAELFFRIETVQLARKDFTFVPEGIVIVDEIETHLHLSLQEQILPFLTEIFPRFQFIVATHSPAVIASIPNAVVFDLRSRTRTLSDHFRGVRYGTMMTEHFGISSEIDLDSTEKLLRLRELAARTTRNTDEEATYQALCEELSRRSRNLAVEVWMIREKLGHSGKTSSEHAA